MTISKVCTQTFNQKRLPDYRALLIRLGSLEEFETQKNGDLLEGKPNLNFQIPPKSPTPFNFHTVLGMKPLMKRKTVK